MSRKRNRGASRRGESAQAKAGAGRAAPGPERTAPPAKPAPKAERLSAAQVAARQRRRRATMRRNGIIAVIALALVAGAAALYWRDASLPGESVAQQPSPHLTSADEPHTYLTDPPTSGPHMPDTATWGVHTTPITKELQVHNLEDGGVVLNYQPDLDTETVDRLTALVESYDAHVVLAPYPELSDPIVATAWRRIDRLPAWDEARLRRFIDAYRGIDHHGESGS